MKVTSKEATNNCNSTTSCNIESVEKQSDECNSFLDDESLLDIGINDLTCLFLPESKGLGSLIFCKQCDPLIRCKSISKRP
jgi:hypothetical protein